MACRLLIKGLCTADFTKGKRAPILCEKILLEIKQACEDTKRAECKERMIFDLREVPLV